MKISRWYHTISTAACVMLFTMGGLQMLESQSYIMAAVFLFLVFAVPLQHEYMRDDLLKPESESGSGRDTVNGKDAGVESGSVDVGR